MPPKRPKALEKAARAPGQSQIRQFLRKLLKDDAKTATGSTARSPTSSKTQKGSSEDKGTFSLKPLGASSKDKQSSTATKPQHAPAMSKKSPKGSTGNSTESTKSQASPKSKKTATGPMENSTTSSTTQDVFSEDKTAANSTVRGHAPAVKDHSNVPVAQDISSSQFSPNISLNLQTTRKPQTNGKHVISPLHSSGVSTSPARHVAPSNINSTTPSNGNHKHCPISDIERYKQPPTDSIPSFPPHNLVDSTDSSVALANPPVSNAKKRKRGSQEDEESQASDSSPSPKVPRRSEHDRSHNLSSIAQVTKTTVSESDRRELPHIPTLRKPAAPRGRGHTEAAKVARLQVEESDDDCNEDIEMVDSDAAEEALYEQYLRETALKCVCKRVGLCRMIRTKCSKCSFATFCQECHWKDGRPLCPNCWLRTPNPPLKLWNIIKKLGGLENAQKALKGVTHNGTHIEHGWAPWFLLPATPERVRDEIRDNYEADPATAQLDALTMGIGGKDGILMHDLDGTIWNSAYMNRVFQDYSLPTRATILVDLAIALGCQTIERYGPAYGMAPLDHTKLNRIPLDVRIRNAIHDCARPRNVMGRLDMGSKAAAEWTLEGFGLTDWKTFPRAGTRPLHRLEQRIMSRSDHNKWGLKTRRHQINTRLTPREMELWEKTPRRVKLAERRHESLREWSTKKLLQAAHTCKTATSAINAGILDYSKTVIIRSKTGARVTLPTLNDPTPGSTLQMRTLLMCAVHFQHVFEAACNAAQDGHSQEWDHLLDQNYVLAVILSFWIKHRGICPITGQPLLVEAVRHSMSISMGKKNHQRAMSSGSKIASCEERTPYDRGTFEDPTGFLSFQDYEKLFHSGNFILESAIHNIAQNNLSPKATFAGIHTTLIVSVEIMRQVFAKYPDIDMLMAIFKYQLLEVGHTDMLQGFIDRYGEPPELDITWEFSIPIMEHHLGDTPKLPFPPRRASSANSSSTNTSLHITSAHSNPSFHGCAPHVDASYQYEESNRSDVPNDSASEEEPSVNPTPPRPLDNNNNSCFINALLQCLSGIDFFLDILHSRDAQDHGQPLMRAFSNLFVQMDTCDSCELNSLMQQLRIELAAGSNGLRITVGQPGSSLEVYDWVCSQLDTVQSLLPAVVSLSSNCNCLPREGPGLPWIAVKPGHYGNSPMYEALTSHMSESMRCMHGERSFDILQSPAALVFHDDQVTRRSRAPIPERYLVLDVSCYELAGVACYEGNEQMTNGHWFAFTLRGDRWYYTNDRSIHPSSYKEASSDARGAIYFYRRIEQ